MHVALYYNIKVHVAVIVFIHLYCIAAHAVCILKESSLNTNLTRKETLPTFRLDALVFFRAKLTLVLYHHFIVL